MCVCVDVEWCLLSLQTLELESLLLGLERRLPRLAEDVSTLEREDDGELYGVISLQVVQNELTDIQELIARLNNTILENEHLTHVTNTKVNSHSSCTTLTLEMA